VRVGRGPLDEEAIRFIEAGNPDVLFDWTRILKGQAPPPEGRVPERRAQPRDVERRPPGDADRRAESRPRPVPEPPRPVEVEEPTTAAHARLGSEGLARLRGRYSEVLARISERIAEPERQEELKALAERLNPDTWVTDAEVSEGLESYETTFAALRAAFGQRRPEKDEPNPE
jgi:hypothetical protein